MRTKTNVPAILMCFAILSIQLVSCKKEDAVVTASNNAESIDNDAISTTDSLNRGLVAWYTFNGDVLDHSGYHNNVVFNSAQPAKGKSGIAKTAYLFDGTSSYMQVADSKSINPLKISLYALVKPKGFYQGTCHANRILSKGYNDYDNGRYLVAYDDQAYYSYAGCYEPVQTQYENFYGTYGDGSGASGATDLTEYIHTGKWYSIVYTFDGVRSKLYVNGVLKSNVIHSTPFNANTNPLFIGRNQDPSYPYYFNGIIDEIRIYKRVLKQSEVLELYNKN